jgi:peptidoglycan/xylan/chitin deacetylase (PgdA/CDA1 family)
MSFRFDRFATLYVVRPLRGASNGNQQTLPILMYHSVSESDEAETGARAYYRTVTTPTAFAQQMKQLAENGYSAIPVSEAVSHLDHGLGTKKYVAITFDDGFGDFYQHAFPVLNRFGFTATMYLPTAYIGDRPLQFKGKDCLTWSEIGELRKYGIEFGSHTVTHPQLSSLDAGAVESEIADSKHAIEDKLGETIDGFAYPYAFPEQNVAFVSLLRRTLADAGYRQGVCTRIGLARRRHDPYFLPRLPMNSLDDTDLFEAKLQGGYDWLHRVQYASKLIRARASQQ